MDVNWKNLGIMAVVMVSLAAIVLVGLAVVDGYSKVLRTPTSVSYNGYNLTDEYKLIGTTGQYPYLQSLTDCINATGGGAVTASSYTISEGDENGGYAILTAAGNATWYNVPINCTVSYLADSDGQANADLFKVGLAIFATFSAILVLAVMGQIIVGLFRKE